MAKAKAWPVRSHIAGCATDDRWSVKPVGHEPIYFKSKELAERIAQLPVYEAREAAHD